MAENKGLLSDFKKKNGFHEGSIKSDGKHAFIGAIAFIATLGILAVANHFLTGNWWAH